MLNGYDNPNPTPRPPLTGLDYNHRFPKGPIEPVKPFSERVAAFILKEERKDFKPRHLSSIVIPETGLWRKIGNRTFYRLFGLNYVQHSRRKNGFQQAIDRSKSRIFIKDATYSIDTAIVPKTGIHIEGETSTATILKAAVKNLKIVSMATRLPQNSVRLMHLGFDSGSLAGVTGIDFNQTNNEKDATTQNNLVYDTQFFRNFTNLVDLTGCEASVVDLAWADNTTCLTGDILLKTYNGDITGDRLIWPQPGGTSATVRVFGAQVKIYNSVPNQIMFENQIANSITYTTTGNITLRDLFLANAQVANVPRFIINGNQTVIALSLLLDGVYLGLNNSGYIFSAGTGTGVLSFRVGAFKNCSFLVNDATACNWVQSPVGSIFEIDRLDSWFNNFIGLGTGSLGTGDPTTPGYGQYYFVPPPAGFRLPALGGFGTGANSPAVPAGTGSGNAVRNRYNRPCRIYQTGMSGTHIIDSGPLSDGANGTDLILGVDPPFIDLEPGAQVYYATTKPASWTWYGM